MRDTRVVVVAVGAVAVSLSGCATVQSTMLRPDYAEADARQTVRLVVVTSPLPDGNPAVGQLWADVARHYANDHRDFIVKAAKSAATEPADLCSEGIEGVLHIIPLEVKKTDDSVSERLRASLSRCRDGTVVWSAESAGKWASADPNLKDVAEHYATALGADVTPYVAPAYHILKPTLEALPKPVLDDKAKDEKIDMSE